MALKTIHYQMCGLDYIYLRIQTSRIKNGEEVIKMPMHFIDNEIAKKIIEERVPLRGLEVVFLRKVLGLTLKGLADELGLTAGGILKWEKKSKIRLSKINEVAVRSFCAERLNLKIKGKWSELISTDNSPEKLYFKIAA